jgi:hypothetical protein
LSWYIPFLMAERLLISLPSEAEVSYGPSADSTLFNFLPEDQFFIYALSEQDFGTGVVALGLIRKGEVQSEKLYLPIVENRKKSLEESIRKFEEYQGSKGAALTPRKRMEVLTEIESAIRSALVNGPESFLPA